MASAAPYDCITPGQSSVWHSRTGQRHIYAAGDSYTEVGTSTWPWTSRLLPLDMAVTYMSPRDVSHAGLHVAAAMPSAAKSGESDAAPPASSLQEEMMRPNTAEQLIADRQAQALADAHRPRGARPQRGPGWCQRLFVGTVVLVSAANALASGPAESGSEPSTTRLGTGAVTLAGLRATESEHVFYEPGASRTWSSNQHIMGVKVVSGHLTVYGIDGERRVYFAGEGYATGWAAHRTVNETDETVETLVTSHVRP